MDFKCFKSVTTLGVYTTSKCKHELQEAFGVRCASPLIVWFMDFSGCTIKKCRDLQHVN